MMMRILTKKVKEEKWKDLQRCWFPPKLRIRSWVQREKSVRKDQGLEFDLEHAD